MVKEVDELKLELKSQQQDHPALPQPQAHQGHNEGTVVKKQTTGDKTGHNEGLLA